MCDVGGSFPRVRVGGCHEHVCEYDAGPLPSPLLPGCVTLGDRAASPDHNAFIIIPSPFSLLPPLPYCGRESGSVREGARGSAYIGATEYLV